MTQLSVSRLVVDGVEYPLADGRLTLTREVVQRGWRVDVTSSGHVDLHDVDQCHLDIVAGGRPFSGQAVLQDQGFNITVHPFQGTGPLEGRREDE